MALKEGMKAPDFRGVIQDGSTIKLEDFKGKKLVLYFYPKDNTPGCNAEACNLRDNYSSLLKAGYAVVGVSPDSEAKHQKFIEKFNLPFPLIADVDKTILQDYEAWGEKKLYGRKYMGVIRKTYIIDESGTIEEIISKVKTKDHAAQILG